MFRAICNDSLPAFDRTPSHRQFVAASTLLPSTITIALLTMQGKEVDSWSRALHAYECCKAYGGDGLMTVSEYADLAGRKHNTISESINAASLAKSVAGATQSLTPYAARQIATLPESDWQWFTELCISKEWGEKERRKSSDD